MIIIVGSGRSGTTFLAKLFDTNPYVLYRHEPDAVLAPDGLPFLPSSEPSGELITRSYRYLSDMSQVCRPNTAVLPLFAKAYRDPVRQRLYGAAVLSIKFLAKLGGPRVEGCLRIPDFIDARKRLGIATVIKSVSSVGRARLFVDADPAARVVHIVRHPCGVVASLMRGAKEGHMSSEVHLDALFSLPFTKDYGYTLEQIKSATLEEKLAFNWMVYNDKLLREMNDHPRYAVVLYCDLCTDTDNHLKRLFEFTGLEWGGEATNFLAKLAHLKGKKARYFSILRPPLSAIDRWKRDLTADQVERIRAIVRTSVAARFFPSFTGCDMSESTIESSCRGTA